MCLIYLGYCPVAHRLSKLEDCEREVKMPRLIKGAKWTYGWVIVGPEREVTIPPDAWREFGFHTGGEAVFIPGSRRSGGFALSTPGLVAGTSRRMAGAAMRELSRGRFDAQGRVTVPLQVDVNPDDRLLTVRGSCYGLGFVARGPVYEEALKYSHRLEEFR